MGGTQLTYTDYLQILDRMPTFDALSDTYRGVVEQVTWLFGDMFDSRTEGGPWLQEKLPVPFRLRADRAVDGHGGHADQLRRREPDELRGARGGDGVPGGVAACWCGAPTSRWCGTRLGRTPSSRTGWG